MKDEAEHVRLGTRMTADEALRYNLVAEVHPKETFLQEALAAADKLHLGFLGRWLCGALRWV